jgi:2-polyprenyl-3-methyl-5-hydroxy-6-metoxy-1,4-benzoquinol methylase
MPRPEGLANIVLWRRLDLNGPTDFEDGCFDVITAIEVIEHLENPRAVAREWYRLLRRGGLVLLSTPNNESWRSFLSLVFRGHFTAFRDGSYPAHITALLRQDIVRVLTEAGFGCPRFEFSDRGVLPKLTRLTWQGVSAGLLRGARFSDNLLAVARKA